MSYTLVDLTFLEFRSPKISDNHDLSRKFGLLCFWYASIPSRAIFDQDKKLDDLTKNSGLSDLLPHMIFLNCLIFLGQTCGFEKFWSLAEWANKIQAHHYKNFGLVVMGVN